MNLFNTRVTFYINELVLQAGKRIAKSQGITFSEYLRRLIELDTNCYSDMTNTILDDDEI